MKKLNITKKQYAESKYFNKKYGSLKYVSESGKLYKTDKGVVLALEGTEPEVQDESLADIGAALKKTGGEMVDKVKGGLKKAGKAVGDAMHGIYRKNDRVTINGKAGETPGKVVSASPDEVVIQPDNERKFDEADEEGGEEITRGELTEMLTDVVAEIEKVCDAQDVSFEEVLGVEPDGEADEGADAEEVVATTDEVAEVLQGVIDKVEDIAEKNDIELPEEDDDEKKLEIGDDIDPEEIKDECTGAECECKPGEKCECGGKPTMESIRRARKARLFREAMARRARARKVRESIKRRARSRKVLESLRKRRAAKKMMESRKVRAVRRRAR